MKVRAKHNVKYNNVFYKAGDVFDADLNVVREYVDAVGGEETVAESAFTEEESHKRKRKRDN